MIRVDGPKVEFEGTAGIVIAEATTLLHDLYRVMVEEFGQEAADKDFAKMGRLAVMSEEELDVAVGDAERKLKECLGDESFAELEETIKGLIEEAKEGDN